MVYQYECHFGYPIFPYHAHLWMECFVLLYHHDTVDVRYNEQVDNMIYLVIHYNHWWNLILHNNAKCVMDYLHLSVKVYDLWILTINKAMIKILKNKLNAWYILQFSYYWPAYRKIMSLPIGEKFLFSTGLVPTISI